jgi:hypothetical protein
MNTETKKVLDDIDVQHLCERLQGRKSKLRPSKPDAKGDDELVQYIWRMARFHSGADTKMPVMANTWLQNYLDKNDINARVIGTKDKEGEEILDALEDITSEVLSEMGLSDKGAAKRWKGLLY